MNLLVSARLVLSVSALDTFRLDLPNSLGHARRRCVPGLWTPEAALIGVQGCLLVCRTWLTDYISRIEARAGRHLIAQVRGLSECRARHTVAVTPRC